RRRADETSGPRRAAFAHGEPSRGARRPARIGDSVTFDELVAKLDGVQRNGNGGAMARCPAHADRAASPSVGAGDDGRILCHCHAGGDARAVVGALGLTLRDLFAPKITPPPGRAIGLTLADYAAAKQLPAGFLRGLGLSEIKVNGAPALRMPYCDGEGAEVAVRLRVALTGDRFRWRKGSKPTLYGPSRIAKARQEGHLVLVEGESDAHTLWFHDLPALGIPGAASWKPAWDAALDDIPKVYVLIEPDAGGEAVMRWLASRPWRDR